MKELKMFPQITEETEENLLNLEDEPKSPYSSTPPLNPSSSSSDSPTETPSSPNHDQNQVPCHLPTITTEDADRTHCPSPPPSTATEEEYSTPPPRTRMRSLSGGAYRLAPTLPATGRQRRQSGDDVLTRVSPSRRATLFDQFRPRSKSDSKGKKPTFLASLKHSIFSGQRKTSTEEPPLEPLQPHGDYRQRSRSGSETKGGTMSKMIDLFRSRSNSLSIDSRNRVQIPFDKSNSLLNRHSLGPDKRRKKSTGTYRSLDIHPSDLYECHTDDFSSDRINYYNSLPEDKVIPTYLSDRNCYSVMPISGKVIVLYSNLLVRNAFSALVTNDMRAASVYDSSISSFVGMLTITDFIKVLRHYYKNKKDIGDIENQSIETWKTLTKSKQFIQVYPKESLLNGTKIMLRERIHRLPVYDVKRHGVVFILTRRKLLQYIYDTLMSRFGRGLNMPSFMKKPLSELKSEIGTWENIATVTKASRVIDALDLFIERGVSALPVLDKGLFTFIYRKFDVFRLAKDQTYNNLNMTIGEAIDKSGEEEMKNVFACTMQETLFTVIYRLVTSKVHQLVVIDEVQRLLGIISLSDVLKFLVCKPLEDSNIQPDVIEEAPEGAVGGVEISDVFVSPGAVGGAEISDVIVSSGAGCSVSSQRSSSLEKQDSSDLSEDMAKMQLEGAAANVADASSCMGESKEDPQE